LIVTARSQLTIYKCDICGQKSFWNRFCLQMMEDGEWKTVKHYCDNCGFKEMTRNCEVIGCNSRAETWAYSHYLCDSHYEKYRDYGIEDKWKKSMGRG
jgi:predicted RNA-binding Zn-ribbon protein involved in translation (DUF1610 family)